jgi:RNA polymerase sigma-70 factor (sigma-E family)
VLTDREYTEYVSQRLERLRRVAYLLCRDWHRADDLVQMTVTKLYVNWRRASAADDMDRYVHRILINCFLSEGRKWWSRVALVAQPPEEAAPATDAATTLAVRELLALVPPRQRATLVLRFYCDLTTEQTAEVLGCSDGTVKSQTAKGLARLRELWTGRAGPPGRLTSGAGRSTPKE